VYLRVFWLFFLIGCSPSFAGLFDDAEARRQIEAQQASIADLRTQGQLLETRIARLEELLNNQPLLEIHNQIVALRLDLNKLHGQIEVLANENDLTQKRQKDFYVDLDNRLRRIEQPGEPQGDGDIDGDESPVSSTPLSSTPVIGASVEAGKGRPAPMGIGTPPVAGRRSGESAESADYEAAYNLVKSGEYRNAISELEKFLDRYPQSSLAPSAQYWIGNSYYALRDFSNAISTQETLINTFPDSPKAPDAMLNLASSQQEMNEKATAKKTLEGLLARYPGSEAAEKAKGRLASMK
jgi:tol-pal system protein YbgF